MSPGGKGTCLGETQGRYLVFWVQIFPGLLHLCLLAGVKAQLAMMWKLPEAGSAVGGGAQVATWLVTVWAGLYNLGVKFRKPLRATQVSCIFR